jgi:hypothetical protein
MVAVLPNFGFNRMPLKWILKKLVTSVRTGSVWLRTQTSSGPSDTIIAEHFFTN